MVTHLLAISMVPPPAGSLLPGSLLAQGAGECASVNVIPVGLLEDALEEGAQPAYDSLVIGAAPKAGSTSLRQMVPLLAPAYRNAVGHTLGENNYWPCSCENAASGRHALATAAGNRTLSALIVREPLSRTISGAVELISHHCGDWLSWREHATENASDTGGLQLSSTGGAETAAVQYAERRRGAAAGVKSTCIVTAPNGTSVAWDAPSVIGDLISALIVDVGTGFDNLHVRVQKGYVDVFPVKVDVQIHLETLSEGWAAFQKKAQLRPLDFPQGGSSSSSWLPAADELLTPAAWQAFCATFGPDYEALGYEDSWPSQCPARS